jgi:hypothetical protein
MASLVVPYFHSATILAQHTAAAVVPAVAPWRRILAVEPDIAVLNARSLLLTRANYCVTRATSDCDVFNLRGTKPGSLAILSDRLGQRLLGAVAQTVRRQWPRMRILILGQVPRMFQDHLYDEQIDRSPDPKHVLADIESLYKGMWNSRSKTLDWDAGRSTRCLPRPPVLESAPAETVEPAPDEETDLRDLPSEARLLALRHN